MIKKSILFGAVALYASSLSAQEMKYEGGKVFYDNVQITTGIAKSKSMTISMDAFSSFKKCALVEVDV